MKARKVTDQVCLNHTDRQAVTRCETCFKPICEECIVERDDVAFCSEKCAENYTESKDRIESYEIRQAAARRRKRMRRAAILIVLILAAFTFHLWSKSNPQSLQNIQKWLSDIIGR